MKYEAINEYINYEDLLEKSGYRKYKPKIGSLGRALIKASKHQGRSALNKMLDVLFKKLRQEKSNKNKGKQINK